MVFLNTPEERSSRGEVIKYFMETFGRTKEDAIDLYNKEFGAAPRDMYKQPTEGTNPQMNDYLKQKAACDKKKIQSLSHSEDNRRETKTIVLTYISQLLEEALECTGIYLDEDTSRLFFYLPEDDSEYGYSLKLTKDMVKKNPYSKLYTKVSGGRITR